MIEVGMADMKMAQSPNILVTRGLGSCLGLVVWEPVRKIGAIAHPMLPLIEEGRVKSNPYKFVDSAILSILEEFKNKGCHPAALVAKIFGGGHMFATIPVESVFNIGARNTEVAKASFAKLGVKVIAEDTGGNRGRTVFFEVATGKATIKTLFHGEKVL